MFPKLQVSLVWMSAVMLIAHPVCPILTLGCDCQQSVCSLCSKDQGTCCCSNALANYDSATCSHCHPPAASKESEAGGPQRNSLCHCCDSAPANRAPQNIPDPASSLKNLVDLIICTHLGVVSPCVDAPALMPPPVPSSEELTHNYKQVVLCVWLT